MTCRSSMSRVVQIPDDLLDELLDYFSDRQDVVDGSYGEPHPNREMQILTRLNDEARRA